MAGMSCERVRGHLSDYVDRELAPPVDRQISMHLETCDACREEARALGALVAASAAMGGRSVPRDVTDAVMTRIASQPVASPWWRRLARPMVAAPAVAAAVAAVLLVLLPINTSPPLTRVAVSAVDREMPMAKDYAIFRSEQAFSGGDGVLLLAEIESERSTEARP